jgi:peptidoglycan/xylan/chitin deacetylase (PgdA/CDA1 family)
MLLEEIVITSTEKPKIPILMYHSISNVADPRFRACIVPPALFDEHLSYLERYQYTSITVSQFVQAMAQGGAGPPPRPVIITFDDGFTDFYTSALPALQRHGFNATLYVATGFTGGTSRWLRAEGETERPMLTWEQLAEISASGIECGAHTHTHPQLDMLSSAQAYDEIVRSKDLLEERLGRAVNSFAYPFGYYSAGVRRIVQAVGFTSACAVRRTLSSLHDDPYALARLAIQPDSGVDALAAALSAGRGPLVDSSIKQMRSRVRQHLRSASGKLRHSWSAA